MSTTETIINDRVNPRRLIFIGISSLLLCMSYIMSFFTSFPLAFATVLYGRYIGYLTLGVTWLVSLILSFVVFNHPFIFLTFTLSSIIAIFCSEVLIRNINPIKAIVVGGVVSFSLFCGLIFMSISASEESLQSFIAKEIEVRRDEIKAQFTQPEKKQTDETLQVLAMLDQPEELAKNIINEAPSYFIMGSFLIFWVNIFLLLKSRRIFKGVGEKFDDKKLLKFKMPDHFIWPVILGFILVIWGDSFSSLSVPLGYVILKGLGVFYFFQGLGIYFEFLDYVKLHGFFRTLLVVLTVMTAGPYIAVVGLFDMFINFRKFFNKEKN